MDCDHYQWGQDPDSTGPLGIDYIYLDNCLFTGAAGHAFVIMLMLMWIGFLMHQTAVTAADYFSPTLGLVSDKLNLAYDIAGVTFLAFGNGAPDFFSLLASVSGGINILVAMGALLGGEVFISTVVVGCIAYTCPCTVAKTIVYRDLAFFLVAVTSVLIVAILQYIPFWLAMVYIMVYFMYVVVVMVGSWFVRGSSRAEVDTLSGDIGLQRFDTETIQTALWYKNAEGDAALAATTGTPQAQTASKNKNAVSTNAGKARPHGFQVPTTQRAGGYTFLILNDDDESGAESKGDSQSDLEHGTINLSGGYAPNFDLIIQPNYCDTVHVHTDTVSAASEGYTVREDDGGDDTDAEANSDTNSLEERLIPGSSNRASGSHSNGNNVHQKPRIPRKSRSNYEELAAALYWQQWLVERKFRHSTLFTEWSTYPWYWKAYKLFELPVATLRDLTIPTLDTKNWSKFHAMAHPLINPLFVAFLFGYLKEPGEAVGVVLICLLISAVPAVSIYLLTHHNRAPSGAFFTMTWTLGAFVMCVVWIYVLAGELITCLAAVGTITGAPPSLLGLTVLAWGNSIGDYFNNTSIANDGRGEMAIAGCYGGPVFNILMGLSTALAIASLQTYPEPYPVKLDSACMISIVFLYISIISTMVFVTMNEFKLTKYFGGCLIGLYVAYTICQLLLLAF